MAEIASTKELLAIKLVVGPKECLYKLRKLLIT